MKSDLQSIASKPISVKAGFLASVVMLVSYIAQKRRAEYLSQSAMLLLQRAVFFFAKDNLFFAKGSVFFAKGCVFFTKDNVFFTKGCVFFTKGSVFVANDQNKLFVARLLTAD